jgi:cytochrome c1
MERPRTGIKVMVGVIFFRVVDYYYRRSIWSELKIEN